MINVGDSLPAATLKRLGDSGIDDVATADFFAGRKVVLVGVPGAFTPTCAKEHLPGYIDAAARFKAKGVDEVACMAVNDPFVMAQWAEQSGAGGKVTLLADGNGDVTKALGLEFDGSAVGLGTRCKRFAALVEDGTVKALHVEDNPGAVNVSGAESLLKEV